MEKVDRRRLLRKSLCFHSAMRMRLPTRLGCFGSFSNIKCVVARVIYTRHGTLRTVPGFRRGAKAKSRVRSIRRSISVVLYCRMPREVQEGRRYRTGAMTQRCGLVGGKQCIS